MQCEITATTVYAECKSPKLRSLVNIGIEAFHATNDNSASLVLAAGLASSEHRPAASLIMAMARALTAVRTGVLSHLRVQASLTATQHQAGPAAWQSVRGFAGTYLDKNEVTERILNVVKNFEKVDQSKASSPAP